MPEVFAHSAFSITNNLFYKEWQPIYDELNKTFPSSEFAQGIDNVILEQVKLSERILVVLGDLMSNAGDSKQIAKLFTQEVHQRNLIVIFIGQNLFYQ